MAHQSTKSTWVAAVLLGLVCVVQAQNRSPGYTDRSSSTRVPSWYPARSNWMGHVDAFRFSSGESPPPPTQPDPRAAGPASRPTVPFPAAPPLQPPGAVGELQALGWPPEANDVPPSIPGAPQPIAPQTVAPPPTAEEPTDVVPAPATESFAPSSDPSPVTAPPPPADETPDTAIPDGAAPFSPGPGLGQEPQPPAPTEPDPAEEPRADSPENPPAASPESQAVPSPGPPASPVAPPDGPAMGSGFQPFVPGGQPLEPVDPRANAEHDDLHLRLDPGAETLAETAYTAGTNRFFLQLDLLTWAITAPDTVTIGDTASEGTVNVGGNSYVRRNSLDTGFITSNWSLGGRVDFGRIEDRRGWMGSVLFYRHDDVVHANGVWFVPNDPDGLLDGFQDSNNDGIDDDINGNRIHGRSGEDLGTPDALNPGSFLAPFDGIPDQGAPIDTGDMVTWLITFAELTATNSVDVTGFEIMDVYRPFGIRSRTWEFFYGMRYLEFREKFGVVATGGTLDNSVWEVDSDNDIIGPQVGVRWAANREWFRVTAEGRFLAGANFQNDRLNGGIATNAAPGGANGPVALEANSFNSLQHNFEFAPVGEWRLEASYYLSSWLAFRIGYSGMAVGGVSRASPKIAYALPSFGLNEVGSQETVLINGLNVGFEINR